MKALFVMLCPALVMVGPRAAQAAPVKICVDVRIQTYRPRPRPARPAARPATKPASKPASKPALRPATKPGAKPATVAPRPVTQPGSTQPGSTQPGAKPATVAPRPASTAWRYPLVRSSPVAVLRKVPASRWRQRRTWRRSPRRTSAYPYPPQAYLKWLVEHYVTHAKGFLAVERGCSARISIEMYPIRGGWTVFARYSRRADEEKVDRLEFGEFTRFAERVVSALLQGKDMAATANLRTILKADSLRQYRTIKGTHHFTFALGAAPKLAILPTYVGGDPALVPTVEQHVRLLTPLTFAMGYRGRFNAWGIDACVRGGVGLQRESAVRNTVGGHVDLDGLFGLGLHFLRYHRPHGMISFYYGAGALFDLTFFSAINPTSYGSDRERFVGGGLNLNVVLGFEFMRASAAQFFIQLVASAPIYLVEVAPDAGPNAMRVRTYVPELAATVGIMF